MKLLGYVSDERFTAIPDASLELISDEDIFILRSAPSGAIYADLPPGHYRATLAAPGFGSKRCDITLDASSTPHQFRYDLYSEAQLHDGTLDLSRYRALLIHTHPEYWSREMYSRVRQWVFERGGRLVYLGGNGLDCEVSFVDEAKLVFRTQDEAPPYENRMHRSFEPTAALLGVMFTSTGAMTAAPYRVVDEGHWAFDGTGLCVGDVFGRASLHERVPGGASGHETDKRTPSSPPGTRLLAKGTNVDDGGAEMVHFSTASGGEVFSVGSITWPASILVDDSVSRITRNVLDRFLA